MFAVLQTQISFLFFSTGGGKIKIESRKIDFKATSRIEAKNDAYVSKGGEKKVNFQSLNCYELFKALNWLEWACQTIDRKFPCTP